MGLMLWCPDTCQCRIIVNENFEFQDWIQKCAFHKNLPAQAFFNTLHVHNKTLNVGSRAEKQTNKANERLRIQGLGDPVKKDV